MTDNITPSINIQLTGDEFFLLVAILHQINCNIEQADGETFRSHADFLFTGNDPCRTRTGYGAYDIFRSLTGKVYDMNIRKSVKSMEEWI